MKEINKDLCKINHKRSENTNKCLKKRGDFLYNFMTKDIKEFNKTILFFSCAVFLICIGILSYKINNSYALFSDNITGDKTIEVKVYFPKLANEELISTVGTSGLEVVTHEADSTLQIGATEDLTEYRYRGGNDVVTNNYVYFNCDDINNQTKDTCELYRIIGIFPTDDGEGNIENRVKLIKEESYGDNHWDNDYLTDISSNQEDITTNKMIITEDDDYIVRKVGPESLYGQNNWAEATLNKILNKTYYNNINEEYQNLIGDAKYYLGGYESTDITTDEIYKYERKISGSDYYASGNPTSWTGKIGIMYASDYGYVYLDDNKYLTDMGYDADIWFFFSGNTWLLNQYSSDTIWVFCIEETKINFKQAFFSTNSFKTYPVFYLTSNTSFNGIGDGSSTNPYQLANLE